MTGLGLLLQIRFPIIHGILEAKQTIYISGTMLHLNGISQKNGISHSFEILMKLQKQLCLRL